MLAQHQKTLMEQVTAMYVQANRKLWEQVAETLAPHGTEAPVPESGHAPQPNIKVQKMTSADQCV